MKFAGARGITRSRVPLIAMLALGATIGLAGCEGDDGKDGAQGPAGPASTVPGPTGPAGATGATGPAGTVDVVASTKPESCGTCHAGAGDKHQGIYTDYIDSANKNLKLDVVSLTTTGGAAPYTVRLDFTIKNADGTPVLDANFLPSFATPGQRTFYVVAYDSATAKFDKLAGLSATASAATCAPGVAANGSLTVCSSGAISDGLGAYHITATGFPYDPTVAGTGYTGALAYGYVAKASALLIRKGNYRLYNDFASDALAFGDAGAGNATAYVSTANVAACESCHGKPYQKHGYREAQVANLPDFVACKTCHFDTRTGSDHIWQQMLDDPYSWATGVAPDTVKYDYDATVMNDTHMSHAMEFPYPQSMANCNTCHAGKLARVINDATFTATTCKSCHAVDGKDAWAGQKYDETKRAPALKELWAAANVTFHTITAPCGDCHKAGGVGSQFSTYHSGYDAMIYDASGTKYNTLYTASVDSVTFDKTTNVMNVKFSATNVATVPTVTISFYGYDSKDFYISAHTRDASNLCKSVNSTTGAVTPQGCRMEYTAGVNGDTNVNNDNPLFTEVATGTPGKWEVNLDLTKYVQPTSTASPTTTSAKIGTIPELITAGTLKKVEVAVLPSLKIGTQTVAIDAVSKTVDLATSGFVTAAFNSITDVGKCNDCHDALGTTFHNPSYGGSVVVCRTCHQVTNGGSHLEMQSRSIDSYAHAIHAFQYFDTNNVDFAEPVAAARYERHIEHTFPNFTILSCEGCHNTGKFNVPDQSKSMPSLLSASYTLKGKDRAIGTVPSYATGAAGRACAGCHRAEMINVDAAGDLASLNSHVDQNGFMLENDTNKGLQPLYAVIDKIMGIFK